MTSSEMAGYQSEAQDITGGAQRFHTTHALCGRAQATPVGAENAPPVSEERTMPPSLHTYGHNGATQKLHILSILHILNSIKTELAEMPHYKKEHLRILRPLKKARGLYRYQDPIQTPQACPPPHSAQ